MKAVRLILVGVLLTSFVLFAANNWTYASVILPNGSTVATPLPVIVAIAFLIGWLPMLLIHTASRASWKRRAAKAGRLSEDVIAAPRTTPTATAFVPVFPAYPSPASERPIVVPPPAGA